VSSYWFASHSRRGSAASVTGIAEDGRAVATITLTAEVSEPDGTPRSAELTDSDRVRAGRSHRP
jgi:hypothetical protein